MAEFSNNVGAAVSLDDGLKRKKRKERVVESERVRNETQYGVVLLARGRI